LSGSVVNIYVSPNPGRFMFARISLLICIAVWLSSVSAAQRFQASIDQSRWKVESSRVRCALSHEIPRYGEGRFVYSAGGELAFEMSVLDAPVRDSVASLMSVAPFWRAAASKELGQLSLSRGSLPVYVSRDLAQRMLYELNAGMLPTLQYRDFADQSEDVVVALSSVNFHERLPEFQRCVSQLMPYGADQLKDLVLYFDDNKYALSDEAKQQLDTMALYVSANRNIQLNVHGHADDAGGPKYNQTLSERRAGEVKKYLLAKGVAAAQMMLTATGDKNPVASNRTAEGRGQNRRVTVAVVRLR